MILKSLSLNNFGIYKGFNHLNLDTSETKNGFKPIVLIGGQNGAGKSTIFEAIKLTLYGQKSISEKSSLADYKNYLVSRKNWNSSEEDESSVELKFSIFRNNTDPSLARDYEYKVKRSWHVQNSLVSNENFEIYEDGVLLDLDHSFWQDFIDEVIPQGVVDLFFFDGEKIQDLAEGGSNGLKEAIRSLLNIKIIPSLSNDLDMLLKKQALSNNNSETAKKIKEINTLKSTLETKFNLVKDQLAAKEGKLNSIKTSIKKLEQKIKDIGGEFYQERDRLTSERSKEETQKTLMSENISKLMIEHGPFLLSNGLVEKVYKSMKSDIAISEKEVVKEVLTIKRKELDKAIVGFLKDLKIDKDAKSTFTSRVSGYTESWLTTMDGDKKFDLSVNELRRAIDILDELPKSKNTLKEQFQILEMHERKIKRLKESLDRAFDDDKVKDLHKQLNEESIKLGQYQKDVTNLEGELDCTLREIKDCDKKLEKLHGEMDRTEDFGVNFGRVGNVLKILKEFEKELTRNKISLLEDEILDCYKKIHRKEGFIQRFAIDPDSYNVFMFDSMNKQVPVNKLSAGERQIYAICVLWALSRLSGMYLPMVIDTPLGRLDSIHRDHLVKHFFPYASHQVVILSTDTEIDDIYYSQMSESIHCTYNIDFSMTQKTTNVSSGYFKQFSEARA